MLTDFGFRVPAVRLLEAHRTAAAPGVGGWQYLFTWPTPAFGGVMGSCHALEIPFVFDNVHKKGAELFLGGPAGPELHALAEAVQDAWIAFARTGDPNHAGLPDWPAYEPTDHPVMRLDVERELLHHPHRAELDCWAGVI